MTIYILSRYYDGLPTCQKIRLLDQGIPKLKLKHGENRYTQIRTENITFPHTRVVTRK